MNKKIYIIITILILVICGISYHYLFVNQNNQITPSDAEELCFFVLGEKDEKTGFAFSFGTTGIIENNNKKYYTVRASWLVNNNHMSYIGDFFVSVDGKEIYSGYVSPDEYKMDELIWSK